MGMAHLRTRDNLIPSIDDMIPLISCFIKECCLNTVCLRYLLEKYRYCVCECPLRLIWTSSHAWLASLDERWVGIAVRVRSTKRYVATAEGLLTRSHFELR